MDAHWLASLRDLNGVEQLEQLRVGPNTEVDVLGLDGLHFALLSQVTSQFQNLSSDVLEDGSHEGTGGRARSFAVSALLDVSVQSSNWEQGACSGGTRDCLRFVCISRSSRFVSLSFCWH